ncbi:prolyl oligopeptidase family serine peptidase [uncultured Hoeflea sp.]|uniref:alpha/beta hydrolase family protein n=1 Tax=uncultured Hoeflea sp. TaxID=538666 RepID=UPI002622C384|nr:prolyl oligopeptidase family serine peptidase [uncultured Hoeflea sp.]
MKKLLALFAAIIATSLLLYGLVSLDAGARHDGLAAAGLPPLIPVRDFYASGDAQWDYKISDDGEWISWRRARLFGEELAVASVAAMDRPSVISEPAVTRHFFDIQGRLCIVVRDRIWAMPPANPDRANWQDATPTLPGSADASPASPDHGLTAMHPERNPNHADARHFSGPPMDVKGSAPGPSEAASGKIVIWPGIDGKQLGYRSGMGPGGVRVTEVRSGPQNRWQVLRRHPGDQVFRPVTGALDGNVIQAVSGGGGDGPVLVETALPGPGATQPDRVVAGFENAGVASALVLTADGAGPVDIIRSDGLAPISRALTPRGEAFLDLVTEGIERMSWRIVSASRSREIFLVSRSVGRIATDHLLVDLNTRSARIIDSSSFAGQHRRSLAQKTPVAFAARDGRRIHALLTRPKTGADPGPLPAVVLTRDAPLASSAWSAGHTAQFLANRGYVVLSISSRDLPEVDGRLGSSSPTPMKHDPGNQLAQAARWLVAEGIADPDALAVMGHGRGGQVALNTMAHHPGLFQAAIIQSPVSDQAALQTSTPQGQDGEPEGTIRPLAPSQTETKSTARKNGSAARLAGMVDGPVLLTHGTSDEVADYRRTELLVEALSEARKPHMAVYFNNEGHHYRRWQTQVRLARHTESFLARHLGGRNGRYDFVELAAKYF